MIVFSKEFKVHSDQTAKAVGSGDLDVLSTPSLSAMIEQTAKSHLAKELTDEETSVGSYLELHHLQPSAIGATIVVHLTAVVNDRAKTTYTFEAFDGQRKIAAGQHQRVVVKKAAFLEKLAQTLKDQ